MSSPVLQDYVILVRAPECGVAAMREDGWYLVGEHSDYCAARDKMYSMHQLLDDTRGEAVVLKRISTPFTSPTGRPVIVRFASSFSAPALSDAKTLDAGGLREFEALLRSYSARRTPKEWSEFISEISDDGIGADAMEKIGRMAPPPMPAKPEPGPYSRASTWISRTVRERYGRRARMATVAAASAAGLLTVSAAIASALRTEPDNSALRERLQVYRDGAVDLVKPDPEAKGYMIRVRMHPDGRREILDRYPVPQDSRDASLDPRSTVVLNTAKPYKERDLSKLSPIMRSVTDHLNGGRS